MRPRRWLALWAVGCAPQGAVEAPFPVDTETPEAPVDTVADTPELPDTPAETDAPALALRRVEVNQGVGVVVWAEQGAVTARTAPLIAGRDALFRVSVDPAPAAMTLSVALVRPAGRFSTALAAGATEAEVRVPGAAIGADTAWQVAWSGDGLAEVSAPPAPAPLDALADRMRLRVAIVPVAYDFGACHTLPDPLALGVEDALWQAFPAAEVDVRVRPPMAFTRDLGTAAGVSDVLTAAWRLRAADAPDDDVYYVALYDNCGACVQYGGAVGICYRGQSWAIARATRGAAENRVAVGQVDYLPWVLQHELGHLHGLEHVACPGFDAGGTTLAYPYVDGHLGSAGYGIRDGQLRQPDTTFDLMSNCEPGWPSDWTWDLLAARIQTLSSW